MITKETPLEISGLHKTILEASLKLDQIFLKLSIEADAQMVKAAKAFIQEHAAGFGLEWPQYNDTHEALLKAVVAASNIRDRARRGVLALKTAAHGLDFGTKGQVYDDIESVCQKVADVAVKQTEGNSSIEDEAERLALQHPDEDRKEMTIPYVPPEGRTFFEVG